ncbi:MULTISPECIES: hypothetical protein [Nitrosopumilus]|uniref:hypothetical protein n=1 Tax=Nitrosopumilus TaxID=338191 RepID=UPI0011E5AD4C|nr:MULTISPECIES: hypothetical protein [Nitrosopumilus]
MKTILVFVIASVLLVPLPIFAPSPPEYSGHNQMINDMRHHKSYMGMCALGFAQLDGVCAR